MKKNVLSKMEKINQERKLTKEVENKVKARIIANAAICIALLILIFAIKIISKFLNNGLSLIITNLYSLIFLVFTIILFEIAYKKDSGKLTIIGIELLFISIFSLFSQYINLKINSNIVNIVLVLFSIYYITKIIVIYYKERNTYLKQLSDINNIVKKESKDVLVEEFKKKEEKISKTKKTTTKKKKITKTKQEGKKTEKNKKQNKSRETSKTSKNTANKKSTTTNKTEKTKSKEK